MQQCYDVIAVGPQPDAVGFDDPTVLQPVRFG